MEEFEIVFDYEELLGREVVSGFEKALIDQGLTPKYKIGDLVALHNSSALEHTHVFKVTQIVASPYFNNWCYLAPWGIFESEVNLQKDY